MLDVLQFTSATKFHQCTFEIDAWCLPFAIAIYLMTVDNFISTNCILLFRLHSPPIEIYYLFY